MTAQNHPSFGTSPDMSDADSGALAFQTEFANETAEFQDTAIEILPQTTNEELSEIARWKRYFCEMCEQKEEAEEITKMMTQDLCEIQEQTDRKDDELKKKDGEITELQRQVDLLTISSAEEQTSSPQMNDVLAQTDKSMFEKVSFGALEEMQLRFDTLRKESEETKERMGAQLSQEQDLRRIAEDKLRERNEELENALAQAQNLRQAETSEFEAKVQEILSHGDAQIEELRKRTVEDGTLLRETEENQEQLLHQINTLQQEVKDQRKRCDYFKKISERLSTKIKNREATLKAVSASPQHMKSSSRWGADDGIQKKGDMRAEAKDACTQTWGGRAFYSDESQSSSNLRRTPFTFSYRSPSVTSSSINAGVVPGAFPGKSSLV